MDLQLKDKVALVTGAGSQIGYGKAICLTLAEEGCNIIAVDIDLKGARQTAAEVEDLGPRALAIKVDVTKTAEVDAMVAKAIEKYGKIDILVNNAGASSELRPFIEMTEEDWQFDISVNLIGQMRVARAIRVNHVDAVRRDRDHVAVAGHDATVGAAAHDGSTAIGGVRGKPARGAFGIGRARQQSSLGQIGADPERPFQCRVHGL